MINVWCAVDLNLEMGPKKAGKRESTFWTAVLTTVSSQEKFSSGLLGLPPSPFLPFRPATWKAFSSHQKTDCFNAVPFSLILPSTTTMTRRTRRKEGDKMSEGGREEIEWDIPAGSRQFQAISSPSLGLCLQADINRILLLYLKRHPVPLMRDGASDWSLSDKRSRKRRYDLTAKR